MIGSKTGGTSIEDIAEVDPTAIIKMPVDIMEGITAEQASSMATQMGFTGSQNKEAAALIENLNYIKLDGSVACMVNGAGLAMATMDLLSRLGGSPANFLDVGGASTVETMTAAFKIIMGDPNVKSIFVNIFGGIARCDHIAEAVVAGVKAA